MWYHDHTLLCCAHLVPATLQTAELKHNPSTVIPSIHKTPLRLALSVSRVDELMLGSDLHGGCQQRSTASCNIS